MRVASIHVLAAATFVVSSVYMGPCMGSGPSNLDVEFGVHALGVGESVPNHWDRGGVKGNSLPVHRVGWTGGVSRGTNSFPVDCLEGRTKLGSNEWWHSEEGLCPCGSAARVPCNEGLCPRRSPAGEVRCPKELSKDGSPVGVSSAGVHPLGSPLRMEGLYICSVSIGDVPVPPVPPGPC